MFPSASPSRLPPLYSGRVGWRLPFFRSFNFFFFFLFGTRPPCHSSLILLKNGFRPYHSWRVGRRDIIVRYGIHHIPHKRLWVTRHNTSIHLNHADTGTPPSRPNPQKGLLAYFYIHSDQYSRVHRKSTTWVGACRCVSPYKYLVGRKRRLGLQVHHRIKRWSVFVSPLLYSHIPLFDR